MSLIRSVVTGALGALAAAALIFGAAAPAIAHDELIASDPAPGERLAAAPAGVTLVFSGDVLDVGAAVVVADEAGRDWVDGEPSIALGEVLVPLAAGMPDAGYEIRWRVVSQDGHPISGIVPFTIGDGEPFQRAPVGEAADAGTDAAAPDEASDSSAEETTETTDARDQNASADRGASDDDAPVRIVLIGVVGALVAGGAFLLFSLSRRRRTHAAGAGDDGR